MCSVHNHRSFLPGFGDPSLNKLDEFARNTAQRESGNSDRRGVIHGMACQEKMTASNNYNHHESTIQKTNTTKLPKHTRRRAWADLEALLSIRSTVLQLYISPQQKFLEDLCGTYTSWKLNMLNPKNDKTCRCFSFSKVAFSGFQQSGKNWLL